MDLPLFRAWNEQRALVPQTHSLYGGIWKLPITTNYQGITVRLALINMTTAIEVLESLLMNLPCTEVEKAGHLWQLRFGNGVATLNLECPRRLLSQGAIVYGGDDDGQQFGLPEPIDGAKKTTKLLAASPVVSLNVRKACSDLSLTFKNGVVLEAFNGSSGYEGWTCSGIEGTVVAQGGGSLSVWRPNH